MNIGAQPNVQPSMAPNQTGIQTSIAQVAQTSQAVTSSSQVSLYLPLKRQVVEYVYMLKKVLENNLRVTIYISGLLNSTYSQAASNIPIGTLKQFLIRARFAETLINYYHSA